MSEEISREKVSPSGWTERFTIGVPPLSKHKFTIRGEHKIEDGKFHTRIIVTENGVEKEYETFCISDTFDVAMAKIARYCKKSYHLVDRRATLSSEFSEEKGAYVLSTHGGEEVAIVYNSYSAEAMVRAYNFILSYVREYSSGLSYAKRHYLTLPGVVRDSYSDLCYASVEYLRFDGVYLFATEIRYNIHFCEFHVIHHGHNGTYYIDDKKFASILHSHKRAYKKFASHVKNLILYDAFFVTPPMVYVDKNQETGRYEVKLSGIDLKFRISYLYKNNAVQFAFDLDKAIRKRCGAKYVEVHRKTTYNK